MTRKLLEQRRTRRALKQNLQISLSSETLSLPTLL